MEEYALLLEIGIPLLLLLLGFVAGRVAEARRYSRIARLEIAFQHMPIFTSKDLMEIGRRVESSQLTVGSVVVSVDHFKRFLAAIRMFFGGELRAYASLIDLGKREALLRMKQSCSDADAVVNVRMQTAALSHGERKTLGSVEVIAYGTAIKYRKDDDGLI